jgi:transposase
MRVSLETMDLTPRKRSKIITLHENNSLTQREIAKRCEVSLGAVNKIIKLENEAVSVPSQRKGQAGRKSKTVFKDDVFLLRQSEVHPLRLVLIFRRI